MAPSLERLAANALIEIMTVVSARSTISSGTKLEADAMIVAKAFLIDNALAPPDAETIAAVAERAAFNAIAGIFETDARLVSIPRLTANTEDSAEVEAKMTA